MKTILVTAIGRRVQLIRHLISSGLRVIGVDLEPTLAPASQVVHRVYQVPRTDHEQYITSLLKICEKEQVGLLVPLYEPEFYSLSKHRQSFQAIGTKLLLSNEQTLQTCMDKHQLYSFFRTNGVSTPDTFLPEEFPLSATGKWVIKPRRGMASQNVYFREGIDDILAVAEKVPSPIIQRFISGQEYTIDAFVDGKRNIRSIVPRERLEVRSGEVSKSVTRHNDQLIEQSKRVLQLLPFYGPITLQGILEPETNHFYYTEINPRFGGGVPLAIQAGISYGDLLKQEMDESYVESHILSFERDLIMLRFDDAFFISEHQS